MNIAVILVLLALLTLLFLVRVARVRAAHNSIVGVEALARQMRTVDIEAFRNLLDPGEEQYLRAHLPAREFRRVRRQRLRAAAEYVHCASRNAAVLIRLGEAARHSPEASVVEAGTRLVESATQLRLFAFQATSKLYLGMVFPALHVSAGSIPASYERITGIGMTLGRLQHSPQQTPAA
jgi:hypothetical protein